MQGWQTHTGQMLALPQNNVDTDQLIPARFMSVPRAQGYGPYLLHDVRRDEHGTLDTDMVLNRHPTASLLVAQRNFGCGSSREAAVYALADAGFRAVIATSFGDIFASNAVNNGLLPAVVSEPVNTALITALGRDTQMATLNLETCEIRVADMRFEFEIDPTWRKKLMMGWDDIDLTQAETAQITAFAHHRRAAAPWVWPRQSD